MHWTNRRMLEGYAAAGGPVRVLRALCSSGEGFPSARRLRVALSRVSVSGDGCVTAAVYQRLYSA